MKKFNPLLIIFAGRERRRAEIAAAKEAMRSSSKELAFVERFNEENFFKDRDISLFGSTFALTERREVTALTALYAIARCGITFKDIYAVEEVFGFSESGIRCKDDQKHQAALELLHKLEEKEPLGGVLQEMAQALIEMPFPPLDVKNPVFTAKNYVNYWGTALIGSSFLKAVVDNKILSAGLGELYLGAAKKAEMFSDYRSAAALCEEIPAIDPSGSCRIKKAPSFKSAEKLQQSIKEEESVKQQ
ncbi:MAG: hypothetical protein NC203_08325 [Firmicutes bacterium]|nr:hypothetical protein [[Eubacterium] siraeum]MCM1488356.1 hypothetical protein [Bacillota bacterium]